MSIDLSGQDRLLEAGAITIDIKEDHPLLKLANCSLFFTASVQPDGSKVGLGFGDPTKVDFDSTVQEAAITYPSDAVLMTKLAGMGKKFTDFLTENMSKLPAKKTKAI